MALPPWLQDKEKGTGKKSKKQARKDAISRRLNKKQMKEEKEDK